MRRSSPKLPLALAICLIGAFTLSGCETVEVMANNIRNATLGKGSNPLLEPNPGKCPRVTIVDELSKLTEFADISDPSDYNVISQARIEGIESSCTYKDSNVSVDLKLAFQSMLGTRGKAQKGKPFFSYPFFVAVTNPDGNILAKEVFAASMTYDAGATHHTYYENLRQIIPIDNPTTGAKYEILVGFQLSDEQLLNNRRTMPTEATTDGVISGKQYRPLNVTPDNGEI